MLDNVKIKIEYVFDYQARIDKELESIIEKIDPITFITSYKSMKTNAFAKPEPTVPTPNQKLESTVRLTAKNTNSYAIPRQVNELPYQPRINRVVAAIRSKNYAGVQQMFTLETFENFNRLANMGKAIVIGNPQIKAFFSDGDVMCRPVPMMFAFANNNRKFSEDVVFHFNVDTLISNITFGLNKESINSITSNPKYAVKDQMTIINFLENYKTAFALKRIDYLESIFADDALIIVGKYVKVAPNADSPYKNNKMVIFNKKDKQTYIKDLNISSEWCMLQSGPTHDKLLV
jgi:hypothetical protein